MVVQLEADDPEAGLGLPSRLAATQELSRYGR